MKAFTLLAATVVLSSACAAGVESESESTAYLSEASFRACNSSSGILPTKASLAVAMARELGRWDALTDLVRLDNNGHNTVALSAAGLQRCAARGNACDNTKAILALQDRAVTQVIDQHTFNPTTFREDLVASFARQKDRIQDLQNSPSQLPAPHELTDVGGPTDLGVGACGPHWVFAPTTPAGGTYPRPANLVNALYFFGEPSNPYLGFMVTEGNVAIDPIDGDNSTPVVSTGSCPTYELDRVYNSDNSLLGRCCVTVSGSNGALQAVPRATGYLGCKGGALTTP